MTRRMVAPEAAPLDAGELRRFDDEGYVVRPGAIPRGECDALCEHLSRVLAREAGERLRGAGGEVDFWSLMRRSRHGLEVFWDLPGGGAPAALSPEAWERFAMRIGHGLHRADPVFGAFCRQAVVAEPLAALVPAPARVVQTAIIYKQPRNTTVQFGFHQDSSYLTLEPETLVLAFVALDDMAADNGCLEVIPGTHRSGLGVRLVMGDGGFTPVAGAQGAPPHLERARLLPVEKGSVILVHGRTYHASAPNRSNGPRRALIVHAMGEGSRMLPTSWLQEPEGGFDRLAPVGDPARDQLQ